ncbi:MAG: ATP synthase F1 subunit delta [Deltaproteobacteria bacterium]|nr:ATP synthase F1 subunit delta [Deltaproteobacteria bacterium]
MKHTKVARTYAKAFFDIAQESKKEKKTRSDLEIFSKALEINQNLRSIYYGSVFSFSEVKEIIEDIVMKYSFQKETKNFLLLLYEKKRGRIFLEMAKEFEKILDQVEGIERPVITTATSLTESFKKEVTESLEKTLKKKVIPTFVINPTILGGMITKVGSRVLDGSLKTQLELMFK